MNAQAALHSSSPNQKRLFCPEYFAFSPVSEVDVVFGAAGPSVLKRVPQRRRSCPIHRKTRPLSRRAPSTPRSLKKGGLPGGGAAAVGTSLFANATPAVAQGSRGLDFGDIAILRFVAAAELIENDLWQQYNE